MALYLQITIGRAIFAFYLKELKAISNPTLYLPITVGRANFAAPFLTG